TRRSADGQLIVVTERTLPPSTLVHESQIAGSSDSFTFEVLAGRGVIYGSATDNGLNDPNMQLATKVVASTGNNRFVLPVAGAITGAFNSRFATGLQIYNPSESPITTTLTFRPANVTLSLSVQPHATYFTNDLISVLHASGLGSVDVVTTGTMRPVMLARVYSIA